ncbi:MAG: PD-(D/E)XK nuclease family protein [Terracidiphilus sp.]
MGPSPAAEIDAWLRQGGVVVTASERAARALALDFHRARQAEGLTAWTAPNTQDWNSFVRAAWTARTSDGRLLLNPTQEQSLWANISAVEGRMATLLEGPRYHLATLAMEAHELLCSHAPRFLRTSTRSGWQNDAANFSRWLAAFDETCRAGSLLSPARLPVELLQTLQTSAGQPQRPPLLLAGFDRILPVQRALFDAWGRWQEATPGLPATQIQFHEARDDKAELAACATWCGRKLSAHPKARILVVTQSAAAQRGQIERAFLSYTGPAASPNFEFSLGIPLRQVALPRAAYLVLRWLSGTLAEHEIDWLFSTGYAAANAEECCRLQAHMRSLRRRGLEQPDWTLQAFTRPFPGHVHENPFPREWVDRMTQASRRLDDLRRRPQSPLDWAEMIPQLLKSLHFAGSQALSSAEFQAVRRWQQALETAASLGFDGRRIDWKDFLAALTRILEETLFAPESRDALIQIAGPAESAGLSADAVWFLGATEDAWPASGTTHPLLPPELQREARMPHATAHLDWELAQAISTRLLASAPEVHFSYARQIEGVESRPSRLVVQLASPPLPLPAELAPMPHGSPLTIPVEDKSRIPFQPGQVPGGASVLTFQSQCPFKAFATARLGAQTWEPAQAGLTPSQRGQFLHDVLHAVWAGPPHGIRTFADLVRLTDRESWVAGHVRRVFETEVRPSLRERMPARYLELEQQRLTGLVTAWLDFESTRISFEVLETEVKRTISPAGLTFSLRLDRLDRLNDGSVLVIDYKSGDVSPKSWELPRPDDIQLPLYASFALDEEHDLGGLVFAKVRPGDHCFAGRVGDAVATLDPSLSKHSALVNTPFTAEMLLAWRDSIEQLARDFLSGSADVDPRDYPRTCERCGLQTLCRIQENRLALEEDEFEVAVSDFAEAASE